MKFPKLKHTVLCQFILYFPASAMFWYILAMMLIEDSAGAMTVVEIIGFFASGAFSLWYILYPKHFLLFMTSDVLFSIIRAWQRDRLEYRTFRNGHSREEAEKHIINRCRLWGRRLNSADTSDAANFRIFYQRSDSGMAYYSCIEKRIAVCSVEHLTARSYHTLISKAEYLLRQVPDGKLYLKLPWEKKAPRMYVSVIVILADRVDDEVRTLARKTRTNNETACVLPCVSECPSGTYYLDGERIVGMMIRPVKNYALSLLCQLVFAGRWPLKDKTQRPPTEFEYLLDMSLWQHIRKFNSDMRESKTGLDKERKKMFRSLRDGEVCIGEYAVFYKMGESLAECYYSPDDQDDKLISYSLNDCYYFLRNKFPYKVSKRKMKKTQIQAACRRIEEYLILNGYRIDEDD